MLGPGAAKFPPFVPLPGSPVALARSFDFDFKGLGVCSALERAWSKVSA